MKSARVAVFVAVSASFLVLAATAAPAASPAASPAPVASAPPETKEPVAPVAATYQTLRVEVSTVGTATFYRDEAVVGTAMTDAVAPGALLGPVVAGFSRGAASRNIDVDYLLCEMHR